MENKCLSVRREGNLCVKYRLTSVFRVLGVSSLTAFLVSFLTKKKYKHTHTNTQINQDIILAVNQLHAQNLLLE